MPNSLSFQTKPAVSKWNVLPPNTIPDAPPQALKDNITSLMANETARNQPPFFANLNPTKSSQPSIPKTTEANAKFDSQISQPEANAKSDSQIADPLPSTKAEIINKHQPPSHNVQSRSSDPSTILHMELTSTLDTEIRPLPKAAADSLSISSHLELTSAKRIMIQSSTATPLILDLTLTTDIQSEVVHSSSTPADQESTSSGERTIQPSNEVPDPSTIHLSDLTSNVMPTSSLCPNQP
ncbi:hypothetical protein PCANC_24632 [Puccinia coronata f. sp. avenae]|uniref:Uncharacterized protein n=1 Tax=Puccinia coronata f. sp. avenae TaxID=200324 RepID=A0A2N5U4I9_9BASI|nr:hypothetical protein PCASD_25374 [Puccinia coronata f. sp. avenae]PLW32673.1 hypothetical protein PCANC_24632 [Puccinia coronata f. sp. avenae]